MVHYCRTIKAAEMSGEVEKQFSEGALGARRKVYLGLMADLEQGRIVPGQRLVETDLAIQFGVGRNAVREAMQQLAGRGVVDLTPNRSSMVRKLDLAETLEVLDVADVMTGLLARYAARHMPGAVQAPELAIAMTGLEDAHNSHDVIAFSRARRHFYRALLAIAQNRELQRLFPAIGMHIIYSQHQTRKLREVRLSDYRAIFEAVNAGYAEAAEAAARDHVANVRSIIMESF